MTNNDMLKLGLAGLLLVAAAAIFALLSSRRPIPDIDEAKSLWYCAACRSGFELTGAQGSAAVRQRTVPDSAPSGDNGAQPRRPGRAVFEVVTCPFCGEPTGVAARRCPGCGEVFAARTSEGEAAICPNCRWDPATGRKASETAATTGDE